MCMGWDSIHPFRPDSSIAHMGQAVIISHFIIPGSLSITRMSSANIDLSIAGIPIDADTAQVLQTLPLQLLNGDFDEQMLELLKAIPRCRG